MTTAKELEKRKLNNENGSWIIPDNLDVTNFDFSWRPSPYEPPYIHQFGTQWQKTGGPRYVVSEATQVKYETVQRVKIMPNLSKWQINSTVDASSFDFSWHPDETEPPMNYSFTIDGYSMTEYPAINYITDKNIETFKFLDSPKGKSKLLDIIFVSNGEVGEDGRYDKLSRLANREVKWIKGIQGRENALREAARRSDTDWLILFPGKLLVADEFNFDWQPNYLLEPKHYIFYAQNPLNGLTYGHMAAVCYNKQLLLETENYGLDFTMSKLHDIVPIVSGIAEYNSSVIMTWRTAFREAVKLCDSIKKNKDQESIDRLNIWKTVANGNFAEWSIKGTLDGIEFFEESNGEMEKLMESFAWSWLEQRFTEKYGTLIS